MKITRVQTFYGDFKGRVRGLLKVETDAELAGWGEVYSIGPDGSFGPQTDYIQMLVAGEDPTRIQYLMHKLHQQYRFPPGGVGLSVLSAFDHALWDISAKALGVPVYRLLGGTCRDRVRVYHGVDGGPEGIADAAADLHDRLGITAFKTSPYFVDPERERWGRVCSLAGEGFAEIRRRTPESWEFAFDPHGRIFEPVRALQLADALAPWDPFFYEEPLRPEHAPAWAQLRSQMRVPLATGESLYTRFEFLELLAAGGADIIQPDVCVCGGLLEMRKIAAIAEAHYVDVAPHNPMSPLATAVNVHFALCQPNFLILEYVEPERLDWLAHPYLPKDGYLLPREEPGWGVQINEEALSTEPSNNWFRPSPTRPDGASGYI